MMRKKLSLHNQILLVLAAGFVAGTFFANFFGREYVSELGIFSESYRKYLFAGETDSQRLFIYILIQRLLPTMVLISAINTRWRTQILSALGLWASFSLGIYWSSCILVCGMKGGIVFAISLIPHGLFYGWGWIRLGKHAIERTSGIRWVPGILFALLLGAASEAWLHPGVLRVLFGILGNE